MSSLPSPFCDLTTELAHLPGIGPRSAERIALYMVQADPAAMRRLAETIVAARERIHPCQTCGALTEQQPCAICGDSRRDATRICVVEQPVDILALEKAHSFTGRYHVLGGVISPLNGVEPEDLRIENLRPRLETEPVTELILALSTSVEGDATSHYLCRRFARPGLRITRIAYGLPAGSGLEFADEITLARALEGRREL
jgi:recombination protein RecR